MDAKELGKQFALGEVAKDVRDVNGMEHDKNGKFASRGTFGGVAKGTETNNTGESNQSENDTISQGTPEAEQGKNDMNKAEIVHFLRKLADAVERSQNGNSEGASPESANDGAKNGFSFSAGDMPKAPVSTGKSYKLTGARPSVKKVDLAKIGNGISKLKV